MPRTTARWRWRRRVVIYSDDMKSHGRPRAMTDVERAYLAGLVDGEAYVGITRSRTSVAAKGCKRGVSYRVMVVISMTTPKPLKYARQICGVGNIRRRKPIDGCKEAWVWTVWSREAVGVLRSIMPFLKVKSSAARACLDFQSIMRRPGRSGLSDSEWSARERLWRKTRVNK